MVTGSSCLWHTEARKTDMRGMKHMFIPRCAWIVEQAACMQQCYSPRQVSSNVMLHLAHAMGHQRYANLSTSRRPSLSAYWWR